MSDPNPYLDTLEASPDLFDTNEYTETLDAAGKTALNLSARSAVGTNADQYAEARRIAALTKLPPDLVMRNLDDERKRAQVQGIGNLYDDHPELARQMMDPAFAKLGHDDLVALTGISDVFREHGMMAAAKVVQGASAKIAEGQNEKFLSASNYDFDRAQWFADTNSIMRAGTKAASALAKTGLGLAESFIDPGSVMDDASLENSLTKNFTGILGLPAKLMNTDQRASVTQYLADRRMALGQFDAEVGDAPDRLTRNVEGALSSIIQQAPLILSGSKPAALSGMFLQTYGQEYADGKTAGLTTTKAAERASIFGTFEVLGEMFAIGPEIDAVKKALHGAPTSELIPMFLKATLRDVPGEQVTTLGEFIADKYGPGALAPNATWSEDYVQQVADTLVQTMIQGGFMTGGSLAVAGGARALGRKPSDLEQKAQEKLLTTITELSKASKLAERSPKDFETFVNAASEQGPVKDVYVEGQQFIEALNQSGITPQQLAEVSPTTAAQLEEATAGGIVRISVGDYAANFANSQVGASLQPHLKTSEEGFSQAEYEAFMQSDKAGELRSETEAALSQAESQDAAQASQDAVQAHFEQQFADAGRFGKAAQKAYAGLYARIFNIAAQRQGITGEELLKAHPLKVTGAMVGEGALSQETLDRWQPLIERNEATPVSLSELPDRLFSGDRKSAQRWVADPANGIIGQHHNDATKIEIAVSNRSLQHQGTSGKAINKSWTEDHLEALRALPELIRNARLVDVEPHAHGDPNVAAVLKFVSALRVGDRDYAVKLTVNERKEGQGDKQGYHTHQLVEIEVPTGVSRTGLRENPDATSDELRSRSQEFSLGDLLQTLKAAGALFQADGTGPRAGYVPSLATIFLPPKSDRSSPFHEGAHFYLDLLADLASQPNAPETIRKDMDLALKFMGVEDLAAWQGMTLDEKRDGHEKFAEAFEKYIYTGKAPSLDLAGVFQRFADWMKSVYKSLSEIGIKKVELDPEISGVFDRMLASEEQIKEAEQARYAPIYTTAEEAGMTLERFAEYQALGDQATADAVRELRLKSIADMRWLDNARSKTLKALQADASDKRKMIRAAVAEEVLANPLYRAMRYLRTGQVDGVQQPGGSFKLDLSRLEQMYEPAKGKEPKRVTSDAFGEKARLRFLKAIRDKGGIDIAEATDITGETSAALAVRKSPGLFRKGGLTLDVIASDFSPDGTSDPYITAADFADVDGGVQALRDMVRAAIDGEPVFTESEAIEYAGIRQNEAGIDDMAEGEANAEREAIRLADAPDFRRLVQMRMAARDGLPPDVIADAFGFTSGDELVRKILNAVPEQQLINQMTDARMLEKYGDLTNPQRMESAVNEAIHNQARARFVATELNALRKAIGKPKVLIEAARDFAKRIIEGKKIRDIRPSVYEAAERKAAAEAKKAMAGQTARKATAKTKAVEGKAPGNLAEAALHKRNELIQGYAAKAAYQAQTEVEKGVRYLKRILDSSTIDQGYKDQIADLLDRYDLRKISAKEARKRVSLADWIKDQEEQGLSPVISDELRNEANRKPYQDMTVAEFRSLVDAVKNIEHLGRLKKRLLTAKDKREFEAVVADLVRSVNDGAVSTVPVTRETNRELGTTVSKVARGARDFLLNFNEMIRQMDGEKEGGTLWERLVRPKNEAADWEASQREDAVLKLGKILKPLLAQGLGQRVFYPELGQSLTREERIGIALNTGNEGNLERLMSGEKWTPTQVRFVLDTLTKQEMDAVQAVWDYLDSFRPQMEAMLKRLDGVAPEWTQATPVTSKHGQYRGGYYPIAYDRSKSEKSAKQDAQSVEAQLKDGAFARKSTRKGHLKERSESTGRTLRYNFGSILAQHVNQVVHDLAWREYLIDAYRLIEAPQLQEAIREHYGPERLQALRRDLGDFVAGEVLPQNAILKALAYFRQGAVINGLGFNLFNVLQNFTGLTQSASAIGTKWMLKGAKHWAGDLVQMESSIKKVHDKSEFMRLRSKTMNRDIGELRNKIEAASTGSVLGRARQIHGAMLPAFFYLQTKTQQVVDIPTWWGAYEKAKGTDPAMTEEKAVALADQAVRDAQGSGLHSDLSAAFRDERLKVFTTFGGWFNQTFNLTHRAVRRTDFKSASSIALLTADLSLLYAMPGMLTALLRSFLKGDDDDPEDLARKTVGESLSMWMATIIGLKEFSFLSNAITGNGAVQYSGPAGLRIIPAISTAAQQAAQGEPDEAFWRAFGNVVGILTHTPIGSVVKAAQGAGALANDETNNPGALIVGAPQK